MSAPDDTPRTGTPVGGAEAPEAATGEQMPGFLRHSPGWTAPRDPGDDPAPIAPASAAPAPAAAPASTPAPVPAAPVSDAGATAEIAAAPAKSPARPAPAGADPDPAPGPVAELPAEPAGGKVARRRAEAKRNRAEIAARRMARPQPPVRPVAPKARLQRRHIGIALSFLLLVVVPLAVSGWYLYARAVPQYASYLGFSVRSEAGASGNDVLGGLTSLVGVTSSSGSDTDILYKFIQSRDLVERVNARMDLQAMWSKAPDDPVFRFRGDASLENLLSEWERKVRVYYDNGMIDLRVLAFDPADAQMIAQAILDEGTLLINQLNDVAREDALRYSRQELDQAQERLREARQAMTEFRNRHQLVDPTADVQGQAGLLGTLQAQLAEQLVSLGMLQANAQPNDPRIEQSQLRIRVIREQIAAERQKIGSETATGEALSDVVGQYESLAVDREFAEQSYTAALAAHDVARAEAARQSRYLAAYVKPTLAQAPEFPERGKLMLIIGGFLMLIWIIGVLIFYSLRDRR